ncbi:MAG TPA: hypothetical protein VFR12_07310 [Pyrinomonadaceae bacterium]|nr:hypothetical protein [Pyrinomonadaceae bacterium]
MNEISRMADQGELERCEDCGQVVAATLVLPVMKDGKEIVACLFCQVENGLIKM